MAHDPDRTLINPVEIPWILSFFIPLREIWYSPIFQRRFREALPVGMASGGFLEDGLDRRVRTWYIHLLAL
jgi:hypothetical protein